MNPSVASDRVYPPESYPFFAFSQVLKTTVSHFEDQESHKVYVTNIENDGTKWQLKKRYSEFEILHKAIKGDVAGVIFPGILMRSSNHAKLI